MLRGFLLISMVLCPGIGKVSDSLRHLASPAADEQQKILTKAGEGALRFNDDLPDFVCTQISRRWVARPKTSPTTIIAGDPRLGEPGKIERNDISEDWKLRDTLTIQLSYLRQGEHYKLLLVNGRKTKESYESVGGATYYGDFGSALGVVFQASSHAQFAWDHWAVLNDQLVIVFTFNIAAANSQWRIGYGTQQMATGIAGHVFIDPKQSQVLKVRIDAFDIPKKFPIQKSGVELDYRLQTVGDREFLLPLKAVEWNETKKVSTRNEVEFRRYKKFTVDSTIDFETPPPLSESQTREVVPK